MNFSFNCKNIVAEIWYFKNFFSEKLGVKSIELLDYWGFAPFLECSL